MCAVIPAHTTELINTKLYVITTPATLRYAGGPPAQRSVAWRGWYCFSGICLLLCLFERLFVYKHDNSRTARNIITKFSRHHPTAAQAGLMVQGRGGSGQVRHRRLPTPPPPLPSPTLQKIITGFYVLRGPHWAAQGGQDPRTPRPATPLSSQGQKGGQVRKWLLCGARVVIKRIQCSLVISTVSRRGTNDLVSFPGTVQTD